MDSVARLGGSASIAVGLSYLATSLAYLWMPAELQGAGTPHEFWSELARNPHAHLVTHWTSAAGGVLGLAVVPAVYRRVKQANEGLALFASTLAYLGFAVAARSHLMEVEFDLRMAPGYLAASAQTQAAVPVVAGLALDVPHGFLTLGGVGFWVGVVSWLGLRGGGLSRGLAVLGLATAAAFALGVVGFSLLILPLVLLAVGVAGLLLAPAWFLWLGVQLRQPGAGQL